VHGASLAAWGRQAMRHVTGEAFTPSWPLVETAHRSHASGGDLRTFGLRLDERTSQTAETWTPTLDRPAAAISRQRIASVAPQDCRPSWQLAVQEPRASFARRDGRGRREEASA
jgi:hypothetical protein